ncbi:hypothetical protein ID0436_12040 [Helicobacter pylori]
MNEVGHILGGEGVGSEEFARTGGKAAENLPTALNLAKNTALKALEG